MDGATNTYDCAHENVEVKTQYDTKSLYNCQWMAPM